jgi:hypothetical protein
MADIHTIDSTVHTSSIASANTNEALPLYSAVDAVQRRLTHARSFASFRSNSLHSEPVRTLRKRKSVADTLRSLSLSLTPKPNQTQSAVLSGGISNSPLSYEPELPLPEYPNLVFLASFSNDLVVNLKSHCQTFSYSLETMPDAPHSLLFIHHHNGSSQILYYIQIHPRVIAFRDAFNGRAYRIYRRQGLLSHKYDLRVDGIDFTWQSKAFRRKFLSTDSGYSSLPRNGGNAVSPASTAVAQSPATNPAAEEVQEMTLKANGKLLAAYKPGLHVGDRSIEFLQLPSKLSLAEAVLGSAVIDLVERYY